MIEEKEEHREALENLIAAASGLGRGNVITHELISEAIGFDPRDKDPYYYIVKRWRKHMLKEHKIATWPIKDVGWRLMTEQEQAEQYPRLRARKAGRQIRMGRDALNAMDDADLPPHVRALKHANLAILKEAQKTLRAKQQLQEAFNRPQQRQPIRTISSN